MIYVNETATAESARIPSAAAYDACFTGDENQEAAELVRIALENGQLDDAAAVIDGLLIIAPENGENWHLRGVLMMLRQRHLEAAIAFENALARGADPRKARLGIGMAELGLNQVQRAWEVFAELVLEDPGDAEALHWLLRAGCAANRWEDLRVRLVRYLTIKPNDASVRFALAGVNVRLGRIDSARLEYEALRRIAPELQGLDELRVAVDAADAPIVGAELALAASAA